MSDIKQGVYYIVNETGAPPWIVYLVIGVMSIIAFRTLLSVAFSPVAIVRPAAAHAPAGVRAGGGRPVLFFIVLGILAWVAWKYSDWQHNDQPQECGDSRLLGPNGYDTFFDIDPRQGPQVKLRRRP